MTRKRSAEEFGLPLTNTDFGHENIIDYCNRPFRSEAKMTNFIIARYREVVKPEDTVYFLGDLTIRGPQYRANLEYVVDQLPGRKILILGNHDKFNPFTYVDVGFESVHTSLDIGDYLLVHDPAIATGHNDRKWLCGHVHTVFKMAKHRTVLNIGVDQWGFFPVNEEDVKMEFAKIRIE